MPTDITGTDPFSNFNRDQSGKFISKGKQVDKLKDIVSGLNQQVTAQQNIINKSTAAFQRQTKSIAQAREQLKRYSLANQETSIRVDKLKTVIQRQREMMRLQRQEMRMQAQAQRQTESWGASMIRTGAIITALWHGIAKVREIADLKIKGAVLGGSSLPAQLRGWLTAESDQKRALGLVGKLFGESPTLRYGPRNVNLGAIAKLTGATTGFGEVGSDLITAFVKELDPRAKADFMRAVNAVGVEAAVRQYRTAQNVEAADSLMEAVKMSADRRSGTLDPLIQASLDLNEAFERLDAAVVKLAETIAGKAMPALDFAAKNPLAAVGIGVGAYGASKLAARWGLRALAGTGAAGGAAATGGAGGIGLGTVGAALAIPAATIAAGLGGGMGLGYMMERQGLIDAEARAEGQRQRLEEIARRNQQAEDEFTRLRGQRQAVEAQIAKFDTEHRRNFVMRFFGADDLSDTDKRALEGLRAQRESLQRQITPMYKDRPGYPQPTEAPPPPPQVDPETERLRAMAAAREAAQTALTEAQASTGVQRAALDLSRLPTLTVDVATLPPEVGKVNDALQDQIQKLEELRKTFDEADAKGRNALKEIDQQIAGLRSDQKKQLLEELALRAQTAAQFIGNKQLEYEIAKIGPLGLLGAGAELQKLQAALREEADRLNEQLKTITGTSEADLREQQRIRGELLKLNLQEKQLRREFIEGYMGSLKAEIAGGGGGFDEIIVTMDKNVGLALEHQLFKWNEQLRHFLGATGSNVGDISRAPIRLSSAEWAAMGGMTPLVTTSKDILAVQQEQLQELRTIREQGAPARRKPTGSGDDRLSSLLYRAAKAAEGMEAAATQYVPNDQQLPSNAPLN